MKISKMASCSEKKHIHSKADNAGSQLAVHKMRDFVKKDEVVKKILSQFLHATAVDRQGHLKSGFSRPIHLFIEFE